MALYTKGPGTPLMPLGGKEAPEFDMWLFLLWDETMAERETVEKLPLTDSRRLAAVEAHRSLNGTLSAWRQVTRYSPIRESAVAERARGRFEELLISVVMSDCGALRYARKINFQCARTKESLKADYALSVRVLAAYTGRTAEEIIACGEDQGKLTGLRLSWERGD